MIVLQYTIIILIVFIHVWNVEALTCLACRGIHQPSHCHYVQSCVGNDALCITEQVQNVNGQTVYNLGCATAQVCHNVTLDVQTSCRECCEHNICNTEGCRQTGRGPICYSCQETFATGPCRDIAYCKLDEVCHFTSRMEYGDELVSRGCTDKATCRSDHHQVIVGRRSIDDRSIPYQCERCCSEDLCNDNCYSSIELTTFSTPFTTIPTTHASDCYDLFHQFGITTSGIYDVRISSKETVSVYCDMETSGGGWTVFQNRESADVDFYRNMSQYVTGFGNLSGNFWLGLETIHEMTFDFNTTLYIKLEDADGTEYHEYYDNFGLSGAQNYTLHVGTRHGPPSGYTMNYQDGQKFSTYDNDNSAGCANKYKCGWWYKDCYEVFFNGVYVQPGTFSSHNGIYHHGFHVNTALRKSKMMFRR